MKAIGFNRLTPCYPKPLLQGDAKSKSIGMKIIFYRHANFKTHFHEKGFAVSLVLKVRVFGSQKWPIFLSGAHPRSFQGLLYLS